MSPFETTSRVLAEQSNSFDLLRIIAGESNNLPDADRATLRFAADELEAAQRAVILTNMRLIDAQQHMIAMNDQLIASRKTTKMQHWSYSTGWLKVEHAS